MTSSLHLIIHNIGAVVGSIAIFALGFFLVLNNRRSLQTMIFAFLLFWVLIFPISHGIGVNILDPFLSRNVLMLNLTIFMVGAAVLHLMLIVINKEKERILVLTVAYVAAIFMIIFFLVFPDLFLLPSVPKMYFPNYYNPGILNWTREAFTFLLCLPYGLYEMIKEYRNSTNVIYKKQIQFFLYAIAIGFGLGYVPNFLVNNIQIDPLFGIFLFPIFILPALIGGVKYELFNIKVVARQAFFYSISVFIIGAFIALLNTSNMWINKLIPNLPFWIIPLISSVLAMTIGVLVWRRMRESDILKSQFITTVTHKFRTPLTHIKWASENLIAANLPEDERVQVSYIQSANTNLVELTNLLMNVSESESHGYDYHLKRVDLSSTAQDVLSSLANQIKARNVIISKELSADSFAKYDESRIKFIIQTIIENSIHYTDAGAKISIHVFKQEDYIHFSVTDNGIGIPVAEIPLLFSKFYRGRQARLSDTEGMGIGLYISKEIITRHGGKIWAESKGKGKGSTFAFTLPASK